MRVRFRNGLAHVQRGLPELRLRRGLLRPSDHGGEARRVPMFKVFGRDGRQVARFERNESQLSVEIQFDSESAVAELEKNFISTIESTYTQDVEGLESLLETFGSQFHPRHYLMLIVKWLLVGTKMG